MTDIIIKEQLFPHSIQSVWQAITQEDRISTWFLPANFKAEKGFRYTFNGSSADCSPITGEVIEATPYRLQYTWIVTEHPTKTLVTWTLEEVDGSTKVYLEHSGISKYKGKTAVDMFKSFNGGWDNCLSQLNQYLKK